MRTDYVSECTSVTTGTFNTRAHGHSHTHKSAHCASKVKPLFKLTQIDPFSYKFPCFSLPICAIFISLASHSPTNTPLFHSTVICHHNLLGKSWQVEDSCGYFLWQDKSVSLVLIYLGCWGKFHSHRFSPLRHHRHVVFYFPCFACIKLQSAEGWSSERRNSYFVIMAQYSWAVCAHFNRLQLPVPEGYQ